MDGLELKVSNDVTLRNLRMEDVLDLFDLVDRSREYLGVMASMGKKHG
jgi:hypothetical protein